MAVAELEKETLLTVEEESQFKIVWKRFKKHRLAVAGLIAVVILILVCAFATFLIPYDPLESLKDSRGIILKNAPPSPEHVMGTDSIGRDVFSRLLYAGQISLLVAFTVVMTSDTFGTFVGAVSGYVGGVVDDLIMRVVEFLTTLPLLALLLAFSALLRGIEIPGLDQTWNSVVIITLILIIFGWMGATFLSRGMVLSLRDQDFAEAARALGMSHFEIIIRHMIPNALAPIIVQATLDLGGVIILESALSFLGFGIQPPRPTWGNMLNEFQDDMWTQPMKVFFPGLAIFITSLAFNFVGDGMRDALDPRLKN
jgi:peptide/nickel transport system permease protein